MDNVWMLLIVAGLVVGVVLVSGTLMDTQTVSPRESEEPTAESAPEESQSTYDQESKSDLSGEVTTLDFKVDITRDGESYTHRFRVRHPDTKDEDIRIDSTRNDGAEMTIILKGSTDEGWVNDYSSNEWTYFTGIAFTQMWQNRSDRYLAYRVKEWQEMEGEKFKVKGEDGTARVYDIRVNRDMPSSVFTR
ncbi:MAG: hypothetical protein V5A87_02125 [Candidatus Bipolaricaulota bacterium]|nr:hypothetical protein [Candidatus Bipolaricaulota bacterium]MBS3792247.1 hypothetical protein [Candidatus Bipolaricaulota bacterium]